MIYDITPITFNQLDLLSAGHPQGGFQQTGHMAHLAEPDVDATDLIGVTRNGVLSAGCLIAWTRGRLGLEGSIWLGPLCALDDPKLLEHMTRGIRLAARRRHAVSVTCWPNIEYQRHDAAGNPIGVPDTMILDAYRSCGWRHQGFDTGYGKVVNRWNWIRTFDGIKDEKTLLASYKPRTRWSVNRAKTSGVQIRELAADDLGMFASIEQKTARRRGFTARDENYYRRFKETFGSRAHFMLAEIHAGELLTRLTAEYDKLAERLDLLRTQYENHPTSRIKRQEDDITRNLTAMEHRLNEARALASRGSVIPAACALFVEHRREIVYLTAGALPEYRSYQAPALLVHEGMLRLCVNRSRMPRFNMYGITGVFNDPDDEGRGVLEFKQGFDGHAEELAGAFILPTSTIRYKLSEAAHTIKLLKEAGRRRILLTKARKPRPTSGSCTGSRPGTTVWRRATYHACSADCWPASANTGKETPLARHDSDERVINRREIKNAIAEYLYGSGYPIDVDHMGDFLFDDRMAETPEYEIRLKGE